MKFDYIKTIIMDNLNVQNPPKETTIPPELVKEWLSKNAEKEKFIVFEGVTFSTRKLQELIKKMLGEGSGNE
jgi:hypothetical protein